MKRSLFLVLLFCITSVFGQKQIYKVDGLKEKIASQKIVAILPFPTTITYKKQPKNFNAEAHKEQEQSMAKNIQSSMYTFLLRKSSNYTVTFQDVDQTNAILKKAGVEDKLSEMTKDEIAKILGVDAIIGGKFEQNNTKSEAGAIVGAVLFGALGSKTGAGTLTLTINDGKDGLLLWRFYHTMTDNVFISTDVVVEKMMRKVSRNFPYTK